MEKRFKQLVAQLISGTQVPRSLGVLGEAQEPWDRLAEMLDLFGYPDADKILEAIDRLDEAQP